VTEPVWKTPKASRGDWESRGERKIDTLMGESKKWPTALAGDANGIKAMARGNLSLNQTSTQWPTPDAALLNDGENPTSFLDRQRRHAQKENPTRAGIPLAVFSQIWATPKQSDWRRGDSPAERLRNSPDLGSLATQWSTPNSGDGSRGLQEDDGKRALLLDTQVRLFHSLLRGQQTLDLGEEYWISTQRLNPRFVCLLMGWPPSWTAVAISCECAETEFSLWVQRSRSYLFSLVHSRCVNE
jgi:hypothetical protein